MKSGCSPRVTCASSYFIDSKFRTVDGRADDMRHLKLTDAGLLLQRHARRILDDFGETENAIGGLIGLPRGDLRIQPAPLLN